MVPNFLHPGSDSGHDYGLAGCAFEGSSAIGARKERECALCLPSSLSLPPPPFTGHDSFFGLESLCLTTPHHLPGVGVLESHIHLVSVELTHIASIAH